ncbi:hypothetical protein [Neofamilia massiliensis]|uniref:hypothetical protein n=1 Tax=Neofamilia massiliensis TaxID=1673724 RepID=UPI0006BB8BD4|nr:hypothetical protein [Neofamilia massiliensis]
MEKKYKQIWVLSFLEDDEIESHVNGTLNYLQDYGTEILSIKYNAVAYGEDPYYNVFILYEGTEDSYEKIRNSGGICYLGNSVAYDKPQI